MIEKILLILVPGYTYLYIILFENTYIFIICPKNYSMFEKKFFFGTFWECVFVVNYCFKLVSLFINILINIYFIDLYFISSV